MRFQVPQFIEVEDKLFGPLTLKQFIYLAGGGGLSFIVFSFIPWIYVSAPLILIIISFSLALAFKKIHDRFPFIYIVEAAVKYAMGNKLYIWKKQPKKPVEAASTEDILKNGQITVPKLSESKLKDLTWSLDIHESIYSNKNQR
jgi:hypothetical protein